MLSYSISLYFTFIYNPPSFAIILHIFYSSPPFSNLLHLLYPPGQVYCCGQPTVAGFKAVLEKVCGTIYPKDGKIIWVNMRQEPNIYISGEPICARPPNKIGEYAELGNVTRDKVKADEVEFKKVVEKRAADGGGKIKVVDINKVEKEIEVKDLFTLSEVIESVKETFPGLVHMRIPTCNSASPTETDFDTLVETLVGTAINCPVIISDQVGLSRATTGCVAACIFKEFQISASFEVRQLLTEKISFTGKECSKKDFYTGCLKNAS